MPLPAQETPLGAERSKALGDSPGGTAPELQVSLLTGGRDPHYAIGLAAALGARGVGLDFIGSDDLDTQQLRSTPGITILNLWRTSNGAAGFASKAWRLILYYRRLIQYAATTRSRIFHILWNRIDLVERTVLMLCYRALGKRVVLTVHNVNAGKRDANDSVLNRVTLKLQYRLADHLFVHTEKMKTQLVREFGVSQHAVTIIPYGVHDCVPRTGIVPADAKRQLGIETAERTLLFFGAIRPYKGIEYLYRAFQRLNSESGGYRLIIAGEPKRESAAYADYLKTLITPDVAQGRIIAHFKFIHDEHIEMYFKAADVLVLPYTDIFQSGILFLGYSFGLPVVAADVGSFAQDIVPGQTGFLCRPHDPDDLAAVLRTYFESALFTDLPNRRQGIRTYVQHRHSWNHVAGITRDVYARLACGTHAQEPRP